MKKTLDVLGIGSERLETIFTSACMPTWLITMFNDFTERVKKLNESSRPKPEAIPMG
jgi:coenzyme F420-reducing hydrogenase delta subunit